MTFPSQECKLSTFSWYRWELCTGGVQLFYGRKAEISGVYQATQQTRRPYLYSWQLGAKLPSGNCMILQHQQKEVGENRRQSTASPAQVAEDTCSNPTSHHWCSRPGSCKRSSNPSPASLVIVLMSFLDSVLQHEIGENSLSFLIPFQIAACTVEPGQWVTRACCHFPPPSLWQTLLGDHGTASSSASGCLSMKILR